MRRVFAKIYQVAFGLMICAVVLLTAFAFNNPRFGRDLAQAPSEAAIWIDRKAKNLVLSAKLAVRPDVIEPKRFRFNMSPAEFEFTLYHYIQTYPWITDGASLTFRISSQYVLTNAVAGDGAVPQVPIQFDYDTQRPLTCMPDCKRDVGATISLPQTYIPVPPRADRFSMAPPLPKGEIKRRLLGDELYAVEGALCGFALYETNEQRFDGIQLPYPFDRARIFRREAVGGQSARTITCNVQHVHGTCLTIDSYELGMRIDVTFPRAMLCEADEVMRRARKIFDDHLIKRSGPVPGWGRRIDDQQAARE